MYANGTEEWPNQCWDFWSSELEFQTRVKASKTMFYLSDSTQEYQIFQGPSNTSWNFQQFNECHMAMVV